MNTWTGKARAHNISYLLIEIEKLAEALGAVKYTVDVYMVTGVLALLLGLVLKLFLGVRDADVHCGCRKPTRIGK